MPANGKIQSLLGGRGDELHSVVGAFTLPTSLPNQAANTNITSIYHGNRSVTLPWLRTVESGSIKMATADELAQSRINESEARTETKITRIEGTIQLMSQSLTGQLNALTVQVSEQRRDRNLIIGTIVVATIALGALFVAMATYGDALFGRGLNVRDVLQATVKETLEQAKRAA